MILWNLNLITFATYFDYLVHSLRSPLFAMLNSSQRFLSLSYQIQKQNIKIAFIDSALVGEFPLSAAFNINCAERAWRVFSTFKHIYRPYVCCLLCCQFAFINFVRVADIKVFQLFKLKYTHTKKKRETGLFAYALNVRASFLGLRQLDVLCAFYTNKWCIEWNVSQLICSS